MTLPFRFRPGGNARWLWLIIAAAALAASVWLLLGWRDVERSTRLTTDAGMLRGLIADTRRAAEQARTSGDIAALEGVLAATRTSGETAFDGAPAVLGEERAEQVARRVSSGLATLEREARSFARGETADERFNAAFYAVADELDTLLRTVSDSGLGQTGRLRWLLAVAFAAGTLGTVASVAGLRWHRRRLTAAEVIAREQEERFLRALDRAADAVVLVGSDMRLQYVNDAACRLSGYRREEMLGRSYGEFFVNFDLDPTRAAHELDELGSGRFVRRMRRADGKELTVEHNVVALGDGTYLGVAHDMTPQEEAKAALRESEEHLKAVTETVRSGLVIRDRQQRPIWFNQAACEMFGYTREEFANLTLDHLIVSDDPGRAKERFSARVDGELGDGRARLRARRKDGQVIDVEISSMPFKRDGEVVGVLEELRDVMEELTLKRQIEETAKEITGFFETAPNPLILFDEDGKVLRANFAVRELFGWEPHELVGQDVSVLAADLDPAEHMRYARHDRKTGEPSTAEGFVLGRTREIIARKKDGSEFPAQLMVNEMPATGQRRRYIGALIDLTDRRLAEERLLQAQKSEALATLVAGVAHDFNNLLTAIGGSIHLASTRPDERDRWLASAEDATNRAADVVRQLLQFSRHEEPGRAPVDLFELTRQVVELCQETFDRRIDLSLHAASQPLPIHADRSQLEQVLMNLLVNARDAVIERLEGEPSDSLYRPRITVTVHVREPAGNGEDPQSSLELAVADNGVGMAREVRDRIFDPFFTTKPAGRGTGLGLSTVYGTVTGHSGTVTVESQPGSGATFTVLLPVVEDGARDQVAAQRHREPTETTGPSGRSVLMVDDEESLLEFAVEVLSGAGYRVSAAMDGEAALRCWREGRFDLVVLDVNMPVLNGWQMLERLGQEHPSTPVLLVSGYASESEALAHGARGLLQKPFGAVALLRAVEAALAPQVAQALSGRGDG